jgi:diguanylate cyclase (GGDEF)-like protein/PAS domain S-box-containing protein
MTAQRRTLNTIGVQAKNDLHRLQSKAVPAAISPDYRLIADSISHVVFVAGADGSIEYLNRPAREYTGLSNASNTDRSAAALLHPEDVSRTAKAKREAIARGDHVSIVYRLRRHDGEFRRHACSASPVRDERGDVVTWICTATDVEEACQLEHSLQEAERRTAQSLLLLETLQSSAPVGFGFADRDLRLVHLNEALAATTGLSIEEQLGRTVAELVPELWPELEPLYLGVLDTGKAAVNHETTGELRGDPGTLHTWLTSFYPVRVEEEVIGVGIIVLDITQRKEMELELKHLSERDAVTGMYNRSHLLLELERALRYADRYDHVGALLTLDIDNFTFVNDSYGNAVGDEVLRSVGHVMASRLRETDIVARIGGDEFAVVLPEADEQQALTVAVELRALLGERLTAPTATVSIGIALFGGSEKPVIGDVLAAAGMAMYEAHRAGGDRASVYNGRLGDLMGRLKHIQEALADQRFVLYSQPIIDMRTSKVAHRELLIRMLSKDGEVIAPGDFLPIAERFSLVTEIDRWVITQALIVACHEPVTVNLSGRSVDDRWILDAVREAIAAGLDPGNLTFEITETAMISDFDGALAFVSALRELGCDLALDDFGTGFGSFTYLKHLPARYVKIDMEFVRTMDVDPTDREIVRSIVEIAHTLGKKTIAEGVESADVLDALRELGVDYAQGYHLGRPVPHPVIPRPPGPPGGA